MPTPNTEFGELAQPHGRWHELKETLKAAPIGHIETVPVPAAENDGEGRHRIRQAIYQLMKYHGIAITMHSNPNEILVKKLGEEKAQAAHV